MSERGVVAKAEMQARFYSPSRAVKRLDALRAALPGLKKDLEGVRSQGQDVSYPRITYTVLDNFLGYVEDDIHHSAIQRAEEQLGDMEVMAARLGSQLKEALCGRWRFSDVPRWTARGCPWRRMGRSCAEVRLPDGSTVKRPSSSTATGILARSSPTWRSGRTTGRTSSRSSSARTASFRPKDKVSNAPVQAMLATLDRRRRRAWPFAY